MKLEHRLIGREVTDLLRQFLDMNSGLSENQQSSVSEYLDHDEWGLAFELIVDWFIDGDVALEGAAREKLLKAGQVLKGVTDRSAEAIRVILN